MPITIAGAVPGGPMTQLDRPLDFLALTDHSEFLATAYGCGDSARRHALRPEQPVLHEQAVPARSSRRTRPIQGANFPLIKPSQSNLCGNSDREPISDVRSR